MTAAMVSLAACARCRDAARRSGAATTAPFGAVTPVPRGAPDAARDAVNPQVYPQLQNLGVLHKTPMAANLPWLTHTFAAIFMVLAVGLIVLLAFQTTKQEGLSGHDRRPR